MDKESKDWLKHAAACAPHIAQSTIFSSIVTDNYLKDPLCALQLGYAILMNKPIMLIVDKNCKIPDSLVKIAKVIERIDTKSEKDMGRAVESIRNMAEKYA